MPVIAPCRTWTDAQIAALSPSDIAHMNYDDMLALIIAARPAASRIDDLQITESVVLVRHVYALRQRCRARMVRE